MIQLPEDKIISAYNIVCDHADPYKTYAILNDLERNGLTLRPNDMSGLLPESYIDSAAQYLAQVILRSERRIANTYIMGWVAGQVDLLSMPYPKEWLSCLSQKGVPISKWGSLVSFFMGQLKAWLRAVRSYKSFLNIAYRSYFPPLHHSYTVISQTPMNAMPVSGRSFQKYTFIDWLQHKNKIQADEPIFIQSHIDDRTIDPQYNIVQNILPRLTQGQILSFHKIVMKSFITALMKWVCGNWRAPYLLSAAIEHAYFQNITTPARQYIFSNSEFAIRPFWTYQAERNGSNVIQYFYSSNINCFYKGQVEDSPPPPGYISMSWPRYWVADNEQKAFLQENCGIKGEIESVGAIDFTDSDEGLPPIPPHSIALFDISPFDIKHVAGMALIAPYYTPEILSSYLRDILEAARSAGIHIVWKQKRDTASNILSDEYMKIVDELNNDPNIIRISSGISARRVLEKVDASISIPFTSTAILAHEMGRASVYYDPLSCLNYTHKLSRDLPILKGKSALDEWMKGLQS